MLKERIGNVHLNEAEPDDEDEEAVVAYSSETLQNIIKAELNIMSRPNCSRPGNK